MGSSYEYRNYQWRGWRVRYVFCRGSGDLPVICVHGFGAAVDHWRDNLPALSSLGTSYALDLVGFGSSTKPPVRYHAGLWAEQIYEFWQEFIGVPALLIGNSIGALSLAIAAGQYPEMAKALVCISLPDTEQLQSLIPAPVRPLQQGLAWLLASLFSKPIFYVLRSPQTIRAILTKGVYMQNKERVDDQLVRIITEPTLDPDAPEAFLRLSRSLNQPHYSPSLVKILRSLTIPVLILWGTRDMAIPPGEGERLVQFLQDGQLIYLEGLGHCPHDEAPDRVNALILDWLRCKLVASTPA
ncbi:MAG: alpha/beta fold hydrolase [Pseudanabaenaceae cyanobacterium]